MAAGDDSSVNIGTPGTALADTRKNSAGEERQVLVVGNAGDAVAGLSVGAQSLNVNIGPTTTLYDEWSGTLDTTDRWTVTGTAPSVASGYMTMSSVAGYNALRSKTNIPVTIGYIYLAMGMRLETSAATGATRFWGLGSVPGTPSATSMAQEGVGFEVDATGALYAVTYTGGVRTAVAALPSGAAPTGTGANTAATVPNYRDGAWHRYAFEFRVTAVYFYIDNLQIPVASLSFPSVAAQELPVTVARYNGTITGTPVFDNIAVAVGDTARMNQQISDGTFPWRKAYVSKAGALGIGGASITSTSGAIAAASTGTVGPADASAAGNVSFIVKNTVATSAWAGAPVLVFEQSDDNVSWSPLVVIRNDNGAFASTFTLPAGTANASIIFEAPLEAINYIRVRCTTGPTTNGLTIVIALGTLPFQSIVGANLNTTPTLPLGTATGTTPAVSGQVGRVVRATSTAAFTTGQTLIAAPAAGTRIYVTGITASNEGAAATVIRLFQGTSAPSAATASFVVSNDVFDLPLAASGGGASIPFPPIAPWALPLATALGMTASVATTWDVTVNYYVAP